MSEACPATLARDGSEGDGAAVARAAADWLSLAAAPVFAAMALATAALIGGMDPLCSATPHGSLLGGMAPMYLLMGAFHSGPWLRLIAGRRSCRRVSSVE
jgi:hypothetical protein